MMNREAFEKVFPVPEGAMYSEEHDGYLYAADDGTGLIALVGQATSVMVYCHMWAAWQAAKADSAAQVEALQQQRRALRGQLENCIGHLNRASRHGRDDIFRDAIESAAAAMAATEPKP